MAGKIEAWRVDLAMFQVIPDHGCLVSDKCTRCPLDRCVEELPRKVRAAVLDQSCPERSRRNGKRLQ